MKKIIILIFLFAVLKFDAAAQVVKEEGELYFTYVGPSIGGGRNQIAYRGWSSESNARESKLISGNYINGGFILDIFVKNMIGEFGLDYVNNFSSGKPDVSVQHLMLTSAGKFAYSLNNFSALTCGVGVYLETPPASRSYRGGGLNGVIGAVFDISRDWKIIFDFVCRYGFFGIGDDSSKLSLGGKIGVVYKVGRI